MTGIRAYPLTDDFKNLLDDFNDFKKMLKIGKQLKIL